MFWKSRRYFSSLSRSASRACLAWGDLESIDAQRIERREHLDRFREDRAVNLHLALKPGFLVLCQILQDR